uniref:BZIP domain-containing protein n=1 Tax=Timema cristinae TaxID=61476 RepID=A0A7R9CB35_TIMCR|nr:unnamed protein product [Timema cristinae]
MYNLNVNVAMNNNLLCVENSCTTPKTPEILNSLMAMTNPFDGYNANRGGSGPRVGACPPGAGSSDATGSSTSSGSPLGSPTTPPSIQHTCSQLIKEGLKLTIQTKRRQTGRSTLDDNPFDGHLPPSKLARREEEVSHNVDHYDDDDYDDLFSPGFGLIKEGLKLTIQTKRRQTGRSTLDDNPFDGHLPPSKLARREEEVSHNVDHYDDDDYDDLFSPGFGLTPEDEERRRRRRERNKIAATKCRLKKRERTVNLVQESEILETQNHDLKSQIQELESQRRRLMEMLSMHSPTCMRNSRPPPRSVRTTPHPHVDAGQQMVAQYTSPGTMMSDLGPDVTYTNLMDVQAPAGYHPYTSTSCSFSGGYSTSSGGVDNGCMA